MPNQITAGVPDDADLCISTTLAGHYTFWARLPGDNQWDVLANCRRAGRLLLLLGTAETHQSCYDIDAGRFVTGSVEQLVRFE